jgi:alpha-mannosidase
VKKSERGDALVVRICEVGGGHGHAVVAPRGSVKQAQRCDLLERPDDRPVEHSGDGGASVELGPFRLATLRWDER